MSYILEALKKSESERNQGRVPDLGQQIRMIHRNRKRGIPAVAWLALALLINAVVLAVLFWPGGGVWNTGATPESDSVVEDMAGAPNENRMASATAPTDTPQPPETAEQSQPGARDQATVATDEAVAVVPEAKRVDQAPTVIVPTVRIPLTAGAEQRVPEPWQGRVPHLVEMPMAFQRQVPDLVFNSHVFASDPRERRVMINNRFLSTGETLGPLTVERITEEGVELSMNGERFRVGVVRDWSSPR